MIFKTSMKCLMAAYVVLQSNLFALSIFRDDLILTLDSLLEKKPELEYILVETNGLADPSQVISTFWVDDSQGSKVVLHQTIGVIDCLNFSKKLVNSEIVLEDKKFSESDLLLR